LETSNLIWYSIIHIPKILWHDAWKPE
jgi:hypothetical protein